MLCFKSSCNKSFNRVETLKSHLKCVHNLKKNDSYFCTAENCSESFTRSDNFYRHIKKHKELFSDIIDNVHPQNHGGAYTPNVVCDNNGEIATNLSTETEKDKEPDFKSNEQNCFDEILFNLLIKLHAEPALTRKFIEQIVSTIRDDVIKPIISLCEKPSLQKDIDDSFKKMGSFYKFKKYLNQKNLISEAKQKIISEKTDLIFKNGRPCYESVADKVSLLPIKQQMKMFLELPNTLNMMIDNMKKLESEEHLVSNFVQGQIWKQIKQNFNLNEIVLPVFLYHDDFEPDNPLSSNAGNNKISAFYYFFPVLPQYLLSSPEYIFDALFFPAHLKHNDMSSLLACIVNVFLDLEANGIDLCIDGKEIKVYVVLAQITGDNLAINELLGYNLSFNSTYFCRFCTTPKILTSTDIEVREENKRTITNYDKYAETKEFGIKEKCCFNSLQHFHAATNYTVDLMHDLFEGVARYDIALILHYIVFEKKIIDLRNLNQLKQEFDYGSIEIGNLGPELQHNHIKNGCLIMSASEMKTFIHFLPLMIGHKMQNKVHHKIWVLILKFVELTDLLLQSKITLLLEQKLNVLINEYLKMRLECFPAHNLKPKHHLLLHYHECMRKCGPVRHYMSFTCEQKNRIIKKYSKVSHQRVNLAWSLTYKSISDYNNFIINHRNGLPPTINFKDKCREKMTLEKLKSKVYYSDSLFMENCDSLQEFFSLKSIKFKSTLLKPGFFLALKVDEIPELQFFEIIDILQKDQKMYLILKQYIAEYHDNMLSYFINEITNNYKIVELNDLEYLPFNTHSIVSGKQGFRLKCV